VLDFDELTAGEDAGTDAAAGTGAGANGGSGGSGGSGGDAGSGGAAASGGTAGNDGGPTCAEDCTDTDPCTVDSCDTGASPPRCTHTPAKSIVKDGISETLMADEVHRVTMTSAADAFYYTVFEQTNGSPEITLYRLGATAAQSEELAKFSSFLGVLYQARSAAGLIADTTAGLKVHGFVGLGNDVFHVVFDGTFSIDAAQKTSISTTYDASNPRRYPVAMRLATGEIVGAWINNDGTVSIGSATRTAVPLSNTAGRIGQITPLASAGTPGVLFAGANSVNMQLLGAPAVPLTQCNTQLGVYTSAASTQVMPGFWISSWSKEGGLAANRFVLTEGKGILCADAGCGAKQACEGSEQATPGLRNPALASGVRPGDPAGTVLFASVAPLVGPTEDGTGVTSAIALIVQRTAFGATPLQQPPVTDEIGSVELARMPPVGAAQEGPDWPAVSILPPNKIAVAWVQPAPNGSGDQLRLERYRICLP